LSIKEGDRVRYSRRFLTNCDAAVAKTLENLEGIVMALPSHTPGKAQVNFGSQFRASSMVEIAILEKIE
jgi:hypothetical protein